MSKPSFEAFLSAIRSDQPVLIQVGMTDPSHGSTRDPIERSSPLVRLALAAVDLGATNLVFSPSEKFSAILGDVHTATHSLESLVPEVGIVVEAGTVPTVAGSAPEAVLQEELKAKELEGSEVPGLFLHWCSLNGAFFPHALSRGRKIEELQGWPDSLPFPLAAVFDSGNRGHHRALGRVYSFFFEKMRNYRSAADRVLAAMLQK